MIGTLIKKELLELISFIYQDKRKQGKRKPAIIMLYLLLFVYAFGMLGFILFQLADAICPTYHKMGLDWLYFSVTSILAVGAGIFGSIFTIYSSVYQSKDNEQLISMPIRPSYILISKLLGCYIMCILFELLILIPFYISYFIHAEITPTIIVTGILNCFLLPLLALTLACILGWVIAIIAAHMPKGIKTIVTLIVSASFFILYMFVVNNSNAASGLFLDNTDGLASLTKYFLYPLYACSQGSSGDIVQYLLFVIISVGVFALVFAVLAKTFISLSTVKKASSSKKFRKKELSGSSVNGALLKREFVRFKSNANFILNCSMGTLFMLIAAFMLFWKKDVLASGSDFIPLEYMGALACAAMAFLSGMNDVTAPSISMEGKAIWVMQTLPVHPKKVLDMKIVMHMILTSIPALVLATAGEILIDMTLPARIMLPLTAIIIPFFEAVLGLYLNIKMPNLKWTNEAAAVKQGANIMIAVFSSWALLMGLGIIYVLALHGFISIDIYVGISLGAVLVIALVIYRWIAVKGSKIFSYLN